MSKGKSDKVTYKTYEQHQVYLIPPSADELIPQDHLIRLVNEVIDEMEIERLLRKYQTGGGASRYRPVMMTKLFVYGYMTKVCSSLNTHPDIKIGLLKFFFLDSPDSHVMFQCNWYIETIGNL